LYVPFGIGVPTDAVMCDAEWCQFVSECCHPGAFIDFVAAKEKGPPGGGPIIFAAYTLEGPAKAGHYEPANYPTTN